MAQSAHQLIQRAQELADNKANAMSYAQVAAKFCMPHKAKITEVSEEGTRVSTDVYNSAAIDAAQISAAGLQAFLCSPAARWFKFEFENEELNEDNEASEWLHNEEEGVYDTLNNSNFNQEIGEFFHDLVVLPGATMHSEGDPEEIVRFTNIPFKEVLIARNEKGLIDEVHRQFQYTVRQAFARWAEK